MLNRMLTDPSLVDAPTAQECHLSHSRLTRSTPVTKRVGGKTHTLCDQSRNRKLYEIGYDIGMDRGHLSTKSAVCQY
ncbi:hypothetical protein KIPB_013260 [Kipferlia bialata]|uniref:Uncharacterized protein n=1 Tax=Kipferlia bialata TaxID=797122 RepID=A0A9K3D7K0_9EUKA|nr:hypothetical protein KIPB_013260 [Kipferlia bialata]|eukprot:g13260.t1